MSQTSEELIQVKTERDELLLVNEMLSETVTALGKNNQSQKLLIEHQSELLFKQYNIIKELQNYLQWLKDNVLPPPPGPKYDPDKWT